MKKIIPFLLLGFLLTSCEPEEQIINGDLNNTATDSSFNKEHNLVWNGQYFQLEFDSARARIGGYPGIGNESVFFMFDSYFTDQKTNLRFKLTCGTNLESASNSNFPYYYPDRFQNEIDNVPTKILQPLYKSSYFPIGSRLISMNTGEYLYPLSSYDPLTETWTHEPLTLELISYQIYYVNQDKLIDYSLRITSENVQGIIKGFFRAQSQS